MSGRRQGEHASAEILALERDVARERQRAARSLEPVRSRLEQAESRAAEAADAAVLEGRLLRRAAEPLAQELDLMRDEADEALSRLGDELERLREEIDSERGSRREQTARAERAERTAAEAEAKAEELVAAREDEPASESERSGARPRGMLARLRRPRARAPEGARGRGGSPGPEAAAEPPGFASGEAQVADTARIEPVTLNSATFEQLRGMGMSVTQATRVIAYRERQGGFDTVDDLNALPGFPKEALARLKERLSA